MMWAYLFIVALLFLVIVATIFVTRLKMLKQMKHDEKHRHMGSLFTHAGIGIALVDVEGFVIEINDRLRDMIGVDDAQRIHFAEVTHPEDLAKDLELFTRMIKGEIKHYQIQKRYINQKTGKIVWGNLFVSTDIVGDKVLAVVQDITEDIDQARQLQISNEELERFAYVAAHDLKQPLRIITTFTELLEAKYNDKFDDRAHRWMQSILTSAKNAVDLVADLSEYSMAGREMVEPTKINLKEVIQRVVKQESTDPATVHVFKHDVFLMGSETQLFSLFANLISNAIKFHRKGVDPVVYVRHHSGPGIEVFEIQDNGKGIPEDIIPKIFEPFKRYDASTPGSGIGLAIARRVVETHGGTIKASSIVGVGTLFTLTFPSKARTTELRFSQIQHMVSRENKPVRSVRHSLIYDEILLCAQRFNS